MDAILQGLSGIFEVVLMAGLGFFLAKKGWFWENAAKNLTKRTMTVALPPLMIHSLYANFTHDALIAAAPDLVLPFVSIFASYLAGHVLASVLHISKGRRGIFICTCCIANAIFIGVPVNVALFGEAAGDALEAPHSAAHGIRSGRHPAPCECPHPALCDGSDEVCGRYGDADGAHGHRYPDDQIPLSSIHFDKDLVGAMAGRFLLAPLCLFLLLPVIPVSEMSSKVFLMQAGMPAMTNMTILATAVGADAEYSTTVNCVSLALGVFFVPFYMYMLA